VLPSPQGGLLWTAVRKAGKTNGALNLALSLITGEPLFGTMAVQPIEPGNRVAFLNFEVSAATIARWANDVGIPADRIYIVTLRGKSNPFKSDLGLQRLADQLRDQNIESLFVDPFSKAFDGDDQNSNSQVTAWFERLDIWATGLGVKDVVVTAHAGKDGSGFRGASSAEGWPDSIVTMTKQGKVRYIAVEGRDVDLDETALAFDPATRRLTIAGGSRADTEQNEALVRIERLLTDAGLPMSGRSIEDALEGLAGRDEVRAALKYGERSSRLSWEQGPKNAHLWSVIVLPEIVDGDADDDDK